MSSSRRPSHAPPEEASEGASPNERILLAAKDDNEEMVLELLQDPKLNINHQDGLGNSALHYAIIHASTTILDHLLCHEGCDVDLQNGLALGKDTPLHLAVKTEEDGREGLKSFLVDALVEAGANPFIKNKYNLKPSDLLPPPPPPPRRGAPLPPPDDDAEAVEEVRSILRKAEAEFGMAADGDVADDDDVIDEGDVASD